MRASSRTHGAPAPITCCSIARAASSTSMASQHNPTSPNPALHRTAAGFAVCSHGACTRPRLSVSFGLEPLISKGPGFPFLQTFSVELNQPSDHNRAVIASSYDEDGAIARLAQMCPSLAYLTVPSAPSSDFFKVALPSLRFLSVDAGYDTQDFLRRFASSDGFPSLRCFEWGEYSEYYMDDWRASCTPFAAYEALFASAAFQTVKRFVLRQPALTSEHITALRTLRPELQFMLIR